MVITFYFTLSWILLVLLFINRNESLGTRRDISFLILFTCLINTHTYLGLFETYKWMITTKNPKLYVAFILFRSVFIPLFISYITLYAANNLLRKKLLLVLLYCLIILGLDIVNVHVQLYRFNIWNHTFTVAYYLLYLLVVLYSLNWFRAFSEQEVEKRG
jgi:hypothetical protein